MCVCVNDDMTNSVFYQQAFIDIFYSENASRVLRVDITLYTVLAYLAVFRLEELGVSKFKEICADQEPTKVSTFVAYVFDKVGTYLTHQPNIVFEMLLVSMRI